MCYTSIVIYMILPQHQTSLDVLLHLLCEMFNIRLSKEERSSVGCEVYIYYNLLDLQVITRLSELFLAFFFF